MKGKRLLAAGSGGHPSGLRYIAKMVAKTAMLQGKAADPDDVIDQAIEANFWRPEYRRYRRTSF